MKLMSLIKIQNFKNSFSIQKIIQPKCFACLKFTISDDGHPAMSRWMLNEHLHGSDLEFSDAERVFFIVPLTEMLFSKRNCLFHLLTKLQPYIVLFSTI